jgi:hypothetical protein
MLAEQEKSDEKQKDEKPISNDEELHFIAQAAVAPLSVVYRILCDHDSLGSSLLQSIDRDEYVKNRRRKKSRQNYQHSDSTAP